MGNRTIRTSFAAGELTPELYGRIDFDKFNSGLSLCRNFITLPHGPAVNRPGFEFINQVKDSSTPVRIIPFSFSTTQTYILEFGDRYIRFHTNGGTVLETGKTITAITQANPGVVTSNAHGFNNGDWVYLSGIGGMTQLNGRWAKVANKAANTFELQDVNGTNINTTSYGAFTTGGTAARVYEISSPYGSDDLFDLHYIQSADVLTIVHKKYEPRELRRSAATSWSLSTIPFVPTISPPVGGSAATAGPGGGTPKTHNYVITAVKINTLEESVASPLIGATTTAVASVSLGAESLGTRTEGILNYDIRVCQLNYGAGHGYAAGQKLYLQGTGTLGNRWFKVRAVPSATTLTLNTLDGNPVEGGTYLGSPFVEQTFTGSSVPDVSTGVSLDLTVTGNQVNLTWTAVTDAIRYNVYKERSGVYGYIGQAAGTSFSDDNIKPDLTQTPPEYRDRFVTPSDYPQACAYFEQRRIFAGTTNDPQRVWMTRSGTESSFLYSIPLRDDDAIDVTIKAREVNDIRHIVPLGDMVLLTSGGEWRISSGDAQALTPFSVMVRPQSFVGASMVQPAVTGNSALYVANEGSHIREMTYDWQTQSFRSLDVSILATHLFDYKRIVDLSFQRSPVPVLWAVRNDGKMVGLTYLPGQQVIAWHQHDTDGLFESAASITEDDESALYVVVQRTIGGQTRRFIERMHSREYATKADAFFVDSGLTYSGSPTSTITGLHHLEGETVSILGDGAVRPPKVVTNGSITLDQPASVVHVGLPIEADLKTLPVAMQVEGFAQGREKNVSKVWLRVYRSSGIFVGPSLDRLTEAKQRSAEPYGSAPDLKTEEIPLVISPSWGTDGSIYIRQSDPLPLTVLGLTMELTVA